MGKEISRIGGNIFKSSIDPAGLFTSKGGSSPAPAPAPAPAPMAMPDPDGEAVAAARRRKVAAMKARGGRESTILSEDLLGGG